MTNEVTSSSTEVAAKIAMQEAVKRSELLYRKEWDEYVAWQVEKQSNYRNGLILAAIGFMLFRISHDPVLVFFGLAFHICGGVLVCRARGITPYAAILSALLLLLLPDRNVRQAPNKPMTGEKPKGAVFSDW